VATDPSEIESSSTVAPIYPFNEPGHSVVLYDGPIGGVLDRDLPGRLELGSVPNPQLDWSIQRGPTDWVSGGGAVTLLLRRPDGELAVPAAYRNSDGGWTNGLTVGDPEAPLARVVAHWINLPELGSRFQSSGIVQTYEDHLAGRWQMAIGDWQLTVNRRPDYAEVWQDLHQADVYVITHVAQIRRHDGAAFTAKQVGPLLDALHIGVSFALGRWVAVALPVGLNDQDKRLWEQWRSPICDSARAIYSGWWDEDRLEGLQEFLNCLMTAFSDPDQLVAERFRLMFGTAAVSERGFMEQRILMGGITLEHILWQQFRLVRGFTKQQYKDKPAHEMLRELLLEANVPLDIDAQVLPALAQFAADEAARQGQSQDGPKVVTFVRNRLTHPEGDQKLLYRNDDLLTEAWCLTKYYATLLTLYLIGYRGPYRDLRRQTESVVEPVPWEAAT
jgi:hypothetical protein